MDRQDPQDPTRAIYIISVAAELAGVHPQTLRIYERKGLVTPQRTAGNTRRYSDRDVALLRRIQELTGEGINLAGVMRILELEVEIQRLASVADEVTAALSEIEGRLDAVVGERQRMAIVPLKDVRRIRRVLRSDRMDEARRASPFAVPPVTRS
jgi:MerR family transcriptional regulator/heat shock protein HspR